MKKYYQKPTIQIVKIQATSIVCVSPISEVSSDIGGIGYGGGIGDPARAPFRDDFDLDEW